MPDAAHSFVLHFSVVDMYVPMCLLKIVLFFVTVTPLLDK